mmetsp:Transcript_31071/g.92521  ORF Transcript_31071/g.92521 Transcript_31071/m.92521 type:complete len:89 (-) Transcript_31071:1278-1544(-)|eukprot:351291-Chlamydomonas_euryale.AAC.2
MGAYVTYAPMHGAPDNGLHSSLLYGGAAPKTNGASQQVDDNVMCWAGLVLPNLCKGGYLDMIAFSSYILFPSPSTPVMVLHPSQDSVL